MKEAFEKIVERLEAKVKENHREFLKENRDEYKHFCYMEAFNEAIEIVKQVAEEYGKDTNVPSNDGWIPCSERLPEMPEIGEDSYIVQESDVITPFSAYWDGECWTDVNGEVYDKVIAWQPLPAPFDPKGEIICTRVQ